MAVRARGHPGAIMLGGVLAWALVAAPVGAQEAAGPNVVAQQIATRTAKKITTLLNVISNLPGADRGREKYVNEIVAAAAVAAARGHTPDNAAQWQALGAQRRSFLLRRRQEARTGAEADKRRFEQDRWMWCRLQMLQAAAYIVDGDDEDIRRAVSIFEQVLVEGKEIKNFSKRWNILDRVDALGAAAILLKPPPPVAEATRKRFARGKDRARLAGPIKALYSQTDPKEAAELVHRTRQRLRDLIPDRAAGPIGRKPNRFRNEAEGVVAEAVDSFLTSIILLKDHNAMSAREVARARRLAGRYRIPPALEAEFRAALARKGRQLVIHDAFARWTADPYGEEARLGKLLGAAHPDPLPALRYYRAIYDVWRTDKLHRRSDLDETKYTYQQSLQFFRRELDLARRDTPNIVAGGASPVERYAQALLDMVATPSRPGPMSALDRRSWDAGSPLERSIQRAVRYHLLNRDAEPHGKARPEHWQKRLADAASLCKGLRQDPKAPDVPCQQTYDDLRSRIQAQRDRMVRATKARQLEHVRKLIQSGQVAGALTLATGPSGNALSVEALLLVFRAALRGGAVRDATRRAEIYRLHAAMLSRQLAGADRREADTLYDELCVWDEYYRLASSPTEARRQGALAVRSLLLAEAGIDQAARTRYARIRAVAESTAKTVPWAQPVPSLARRIWLEGMIDAKAYRHAQAYLAARPSSLDLRRLAAESAQLPGRMSELIGHLIQSPRTVRELAAGLAGAQSLLARADLPLDKTVVDSLRRSLAQRRQTLRAAQIVAASPGGAFAALRRWSGSATGDVPLDEEGRSLWQEALRRLVSEANTVADFRDLAALRTVSVPHEQLARRAMDKALDAAAAGNSGSAAGLADSAAVLLAPVGAKVKSAEYWFGGYMGLACHAGFDADQQKRWKIEAAKYLPAQSPSGWDLYRQATLAYEVGDLKRCRTTVEALAKRGPLTSDLAVLGAACRWRETWPSSADAAALAAGVARWWRTYHPGGDPYESLAALKGLRPGTSARRHLLAALVYLGRGDAEAVRLQELLDTCAQVSRTGRTRGRAALSRPYDRLISDEPALAGHLQSLLRIHLARTQSGDARRANMAAAAKCLLADTSGGQWSSLPLPVRQAAADAAYEGRCWARAAAVYGVQMRALRDEAQAAPGRALTAAGAEACRRWLECEVYRRAGDNPSTQSLIHHLRGASRELSWTAGRAFTGLVSAVRRSAAEKIWQGSPSEAGAIDDLYRRMIRKTANKRRNRGDKRFDNTQWGWLRGDAGVNPYASLWCFVSIWPNSSGYPKEWAYDGASWPRGLQDWVQSAERQDRGEADKAFEAALGRWCRNAGPVGRDRRAEAHLVRYLLYKDGGSLANAVRTFAFGNPEYSLAVSLAEEK